MGLRIKFNSLVHPISCNKWERVFLSLPFASSENKALDEKQANQLLLSTSPPIFPSRTYTLEQRRKIVSLSLSTSLRRERENKSRARFSSSGGTWRLNLRLMCTAAPCNSISSNSQLAQRPTHSSKPNESNTHTVGVILCVAAGKGWMQKAQFGGETRRSL